MFHEFFSFQVYLSSNLLKAQTFLGIVTAIHQQLVLHQQLVVCQQLVLHQQLAIHPQFVTHQQLDSYGTKYLKIVGTNLFEGFTWQCSENSRFSWCQAQLLSGG